MPSESSYVAFTLGQTNPLHLSHGQLSYNRVITNSSAGFDSLGSFVCYKPGLYAFHFFSLAQSHSGTWIELLKKYKVRVFYFWLHGTRLCWRRKLCAATPERRRCSQLKSSSILFHYYSWHRTCINDIYGSIVKPWWNWYNIFWRKQ